MSWTVCGGAVGGGDRTLAPLLGEVGAGVRGGSELGVVVMVVTGVVIGACCSRGWVLGAIVIGGALFFSCLFLL